MRGLRRKRNTWHVLTYQIHRNYLFILELNYFCFCDKFFYKVVFDPLFLEYSILCPSLIGLKILEYKFYLSEILIIFLEYSYQRADLSKTKEMCILYIHVSCLILGSSKSGLLLLLSVNLPTNFREPPFTMERFPFLLKHVYFVLSAWRPTLSAASSRLCSKDLAWVGVFARSTMSSA